MEGIFKGGLFEVLGREFNKFFLWREFVRLDRFIEARESCFDLFGKLLVDVPARAEVIVLAAVIEEMSDGEQEEEVVAFSFVFRKLLQYCLFRKYRAQCGNRGFEILPMLRERSIHIRIPYCRDAVVFNLADALASDAVFLPNGIQCATLTLARESEPVGEYAARALWERGKKVFGY